jgi:pyrimidine-nucleoside phosphorylase
LADPGAVAAAEAVADAGAVAVAVSEAAAEAEADADAATDAEADAATDADADAAVEAASSDFEQPARTRTSTSSWFRMRVAVYLSVMQRSVVEIIAAKRDGQALAPEEIRRLVSDLMEGKLADYQLAAFLMAAFLRGMSDAEAVSLTEAMLHSGQVLDLSSVPGVKVDKHSTGGVGDKVSLCLAPLVAACGVPVPMVSGRGLGHTGGTLDKLEAIPGFRTDLSVEDFQRIVRDVGSCLIGQTKEIAPADKRIYAIRDVTATVECIPLIVASILSKKLAEGIDALVLDVKVGSGAFMKTEEKARELGEALVRVGTRAGKRVVALLTDMEAPLGEAIGNANETHEAIDVLRGGGPADLVECTLALGAEMLVLGKKAASIEAGRAALEKAIADGAGARTFERMIEAQHGDPSVVASPEKLVLAPVETVVGAPTDGFVRRADALVLGRAAVAMGAGRARAEDTVDHGVGIFLDAKPGTRVSRGQPLARLRLRAPSPEIAERVLSAFEIGEAPDPRPLVRGRIEHTG